MQLSELVNAMERIAPTKYAEAWDNVGLLVGDPHQPIHRALLTIDYTEAVAAEAAQEQCDAVIAYHPPIFHPLKRLTAPGLIHDAIRRGVAVYSPHTALDVAEGGTNDLLADVLGLGERQPLRLAKGAIAQCKLVVFVPEDAADRVADALFDAGAGWIGNYSSCSFRSPGVGTFYGQQGARPAVGQAGQLQRVPELRLEMVLPLDRIGPAIRALRRTHPYEEPAFDLVQLVAAETAGQGRIGTLPSPIDRSELFGRIKRGLGVSHLLVAGPIDGAVTRAAVGAGACGDMIDDALARKAGLYLTGELRHHDALRAAQAGMTVVCVLHSNSERAVLRRLADRLKQDLPALDVIMARADRDPFAIC